MILRQDLMLLNPMQKFKGKDDTFHYITRLVIFVVGKKVDVFFILYVTNWYKKLHCDLLDPA